MPEDSAQNETNAAAVWRRTGVVNVRGGGRDDDDAFFTHWRGRTAETKARTGPRTGVASVVTTVHATRAVPEPFPGRPGNRRGGP